MIPSKHTLKTIKTYGYKCIFPIEPFPMNSTYTYPNCLLYDSVWISNRHIEFNLSKTKLLISLPNVFYLQFSLSRGMPAMLSKCQIRKLTAILDSPLFPIPYTQYCRQFFWLCLQNIPRLWSLFLFFNFSSWLKSLSFLAWLIAVVFIFTSFRFTLNKTAESHHISPFLKP